MSLNFLFTSEGLINVQKSRWNTSRVNRILWKPELTIPSHVPQKTPWFILAVDSMLLPHIPHHSNSFHPQHACVLISCLFAVDIIMTIYNLYLFDRDGQLLHYAEWTRKKESGITREEVSQGNFLYLTLLRNAKKNSLAYLISFIYLQFSYESLKTYR